MSETRGSNPSVGETYLAEARRRLGECHEQIKHCVEQLDDAQVWWRPFDSMNSIANIVLHLCGNLRQWMVSGIGGTADDRNRPREFAQRALIPSDELLSRLAAVVGEADAVLAGTDAGRLLAPLRIQGFEGTVLSAVFGCLTHLSGHTQEIVYVTRLQRGDAYRFAWTPTTPEEGAATPDLPDGETVAVQDATFKEMTGQPFPQGPAELEVLGTPPTAPAEAPVAESGVIGPRESPLNDYLLALEAEFQEEQDEGKL